MLFKRKHKKTWNRNPEVVRLLEIYLETAKKHKMAHVAIACCKYKDDGWQADVGCCDYAGDIALEQSQREVLQILIGKLDASIENWKLPPRDYGLDASHVVYNVASGPLGFDFMVWLIDAEMNRIRHGAPAPLKVAFWLGKQAKETPPRMIWLNNVFRPALAFVGAVEDSTAMCGHHKDYYVPSDIVKACLAGEQVPRFVASRRLDTKGRPPVTITLREAHHWPERNSNIDAWIKFGSWLQERGEEVVFVRDWAKAEEKISGFWTYPRASLDLTERLALYESAKCNMFVSNGPSLLALFGSRPCLVFIKPELEGSDFAANTPSFWRDKNGIEIGGQWPWCRSDQRLVWMPDTFENMIEAWTEHIGQQSCTEDYSSAAAPISASARL